MSSLPASPNPQKPRVYDLGRKARGALGTRIPASRRRADTAAPPTAAPTPAPGEEPAGGDQPSGYVPPTAGSGNAYFGGADFGSSGTSELLIPQPPAADPPPALPARIPYSEWKGPRPRSVGLAFALIVIAGSISLSGGIAASRRPVTELPSNVAELGRLGVDTAEYAAAMQVVTLAAALVVFGIYLLIAVLIREGRNWARIGASVLAAAGLAAAVDAGPGPQMIAVLMAAVGLGLLYRSDCRRYFRPRRSQYLSMP